MTITWIRLLYYIKVHVQFITAAAAVYLKQEPSSYVGLVCKAFLINIFYISVVKMPGLV